MPRPTSPPPNPDTDTEPGSPGAAPFEGAAEAFLAALVASSDDAIVGKTLDGVIRSWNPGAERLFGYSAAEAVGRPITLIIPPERHDEEREILRRLRRGERIEHFETVRVAKDGRRIEISLTVSPIAGADGRIVGASKIARDIGASKETRNLLAASEERFRALADNIPQLAWMAAPDGAIFWYNARWYDYTGSDPAETTGWGWRNVHHPDHVERVVSGFRSAIEAGTVWEDTFPLRRHDGAWRWFLSRAHPIRAAGGAVTMWFGTNTDITDRMAMEEALREADRRKDEFLATLAHELRNPLAPIVTGVELLRLQPEGPATAARVLPTLERQTAHLVRLVDDLLEVSRITRGKIGLRRRRVDLASVIDGAIETSRPLLDRAGHRLEVEQPAAPVHLDADPVRLGQVFANLLNNAARYTPDGGEIRLRVETRDGEAVVTVGDSGVGFDPTLGESLFELFAQGGGAAVGGGLGIGLTLVRSLVELHGGSVTAASEGPGRGSVFTVRLPLDAPSGDARPAAEADPPPPAEADEASRADGSAAGRRRGLDVLIADDNRDAADALGALLEALGHRVRAVYGGEEALAACEEMAPDVALLDLGMPGVDGYEAARRLRRRDRRPVLVALTGWGQASDRRRTREAGFDHHLVKPADLAALRALLDGIAAHTAAGEPVEAPGGSAGASG